MKNYFDLSFFFFDFQMTSIQVWSKYVSRMWIEKANSFVLFTSLLEYISIRLKAFRKNKLFCTSYKYTFKNGIKCVFFLIVILTLIKGSANRIFPLHPSVSITLLFISFLLKPPITFLVYYSFPFHLLLFQLYLSWLSHWLFLLSTLIQTVSIYSLAHFVDYIRYS